MMTKQSIEGGLIQMLSHGIISAGLFLCVGVLYDRKHSRLISSYGGIVSLMPKYSLFFMILTLGALGLPGTSGFIGEFLVLVGAFKVNKLVAVLSSTGVILAATYMLWLYKRVIFGTISNPDLKNLRDLNSLENYYLLILVALTLFFGFYPDPLFQTFNVSVDNAISNYQLNLNN